MVVSPFRAVVASHAELTINRMRREAGRRGAAITVVLFALLLGAVILPVVLSLAFLGWAAAANLEHPLGQAGLGVLYFLEAVGGGLLSGGTGGARQLAWESYRAFPLRHRTLFAAELVASLFDVVPLVLTILIGATTFGACIGAPTAAPWLLLLGAEAIGLVLVTQMLVATLAAALVRRMRFALGALVLGVAVGVTLIVPPPGAGGRPPAPIDLERMLALRGALAHVAAWLPTTSAARAAALAHEGRPVAALLRHAYPAAVLLVGGTLASRLVAREVASGGIAPEGAGARLWTFRSPALGVARVTWQTLLDSAAGRFGLVVPLLTLVLVKWPLAVALGSSPYATPGAYAYVVLSTSAIQLNQFGLDGHGVKALVLLPLRTEDIFRGKALGLGFYCSVQIFTLVVLLLVVQHASLHEVIGGALLGASLNVVENTVGRWTSSWMPRRLPRRDMRSGSGPGPLVLVALGLTGGAGAVFGGIYGACLQHAPGALLPVEAAVLGVCLAVHRLTRASAVRYFEARRERVVEAIG